MSALVDKLVQRLVEGRPDLKVLGFGFARRIGRLKSPPPPNPIEETPA